MGQHAIVRAGHLFQDGRTRRAIVASVCLRLRQVSRFSRDHRVLWSIGAVLVAML